MESKLQRLQLWKNREPVSHGRVLLIGPYDPHCGEYTFLAPPLGVWRLRGYLEARGHRVDVFDPNCCDGDPRAALSSLLAETRWDVIGISTTGMTLKYDLELAHLVKREAPEALIVAGGMEATFKPELIFGLAPVDLIFLGEGELALNELLDRWRAGAALVGIPGTAVPLNTGGAQRFHGRAMTAAEMSDAIAATPYRQMPYRDYWERLESAYRIDGLPGKAEREARLAEIRSVRLITLNYCPMACTFCSSTNFLHSAQGSVAKIARLDVEDCMHMIRSIVSAQPGVRTIIFQDDIFVFTNDRRIEPLCAEIVRAKAANDIPHDLQFISTNRIDAMTQERLAAMRAAGFRVLGFGVESFSKSVLTEFNKAQIYEHIEPTLRQARDLGLTPFLDLILCSPRSSLSDVAETVTSAYRWIMRGCEIGLYPYVIPFSGAKMAEDTELGPHKTYVQQKIAGTRESWLQAEHILPIDAEVRAAMRDIVAVYSTELDALTTRTAHVPSRTRSLLWVAAAIGVLRRSGHAMPSGSAIASKLDIDLAAANGRRPAPIAGDEERVA